MFERKVNYDWHCFWCSSFLLLWFCPNGAVLCKVVLQSFSWATSVRHQLSVLLNGCLAVWPNKQILRVFQIFQPSSLKYCIPLVKDQSSLFMKFLVFNWVIENSWTFEKHFWTIRSFILLLTEDVSALNVA